MSTKTLTKELQKIDRAKARIQKIKAREREQNRKRETRRKIIAGALALNHYQKNPNDEFSRKLSALLDEYVIKPYERKLFGLEPLPKTSKASPQMTLKRLLTRREQRKFDLSMFSF